MDEPSKRDRAGEQFRTIAEPLLAAGVPHAEIWGRLRTALAHDELLLVLMTYGPDPLRAAAARCYGNLLRFKERWTSEEIVAALQRGGLDPAALDLDNAADLATIRRILEDADRLA